MKQNFMSVANKGSYDLEAHISSAKQTHTHRKSRYGIIPQRPVNFLLNKIKKKHRRTNNN
jgi:hypothetical protein